MEVPRQYGTNPLRGLSFHLSCLCLDVPQRRLQTAAGKEIVLQTLEELEERGLVRKDEARVGYAVVANENDVGRIGRAVAVDVSNMRPDVYR